MALKNPSSDCDYRGLTNRVFQRYPEIAVYKKVFAKYKTVKNGDLRYRNSFLIYRALLKPPFSAVEATATLFEYTAVSGDRGVKNHG